MAATKIPEPPRPTVEVKSGIIEVTQDDHYPLRLTASQSTDLRAILEQAEDWAQYWEDSYTDDTKQVEPQS